MAQQTACFEMLGVVATNAHWLVVLHCRLFGPDARLAGLVSALVTSVCCAFVDAVTRQGAGVDQALKLQVRWLSALPVEQLLSSGTKSWTSISLFAYVCGVLIKCCMHSCGKQE